MQRQARRDTALEMKLRRKLHRLGLRYNVQVKVLRRRDADVAFTNARVIVDVRSYFWRIKSRDEAPVRTSTEAGWNVVVAWEHDDLDAAGESIATLVRSSRSKSDRRWKVRLEVPDQKLKSPCSARR
jgi:DNA mismatch endonuclease (patch repair protein)